MFIDPGLPERSGEGEAVAVDDDCDGDRPGVAVGRASREPDGIAARLGSGPTAGSVTCGRNGGGEWDSEEAAPTSAAPPAAATVMAMTRTNATP